MSIKIVKEDIVVNISSAGVQGMKGEKGDPNGTSGTAGSSGTSGTSGTSGLTGTSGTSGSDGVSGSAGTSGTSGTSGIDGTFFGSSGTSGTSGVGTNGTSGTSGLSGTSGISGTSGVNGTNATSGTSGVSGTSGTSGINGTNGTSGTSGLAGQSGTSGTSGIGTNGTSGFSIDSGSFVTTGSFNDFTSSYYIDSASFDLRISQATNEQDLSYLATTGSNIFIGNETISGSILVSGSLIPNTGDGTFTSSFTLGTPTNAWKDLYISQGSIIFVDAITQATSSFSITTDIAGEENTVQYSAAITASKYFGDAGGLYNLPSNTNWNKDKEYILRNTEQLTFSGDYILENCALVIQGDDEQIEYSANKYFKKEGTIFIGGNLLLKDSYIENNGKISVGGEVILIGESGITGTGTII